MAQLCFHERVGEGSDSLKMECLPQLCSAAIHTLKNASVSHVNSRSLAVQDSGFLLRERNDSDFSRSLGDGASVWLYLRHPTLELRTLRFPKSTGGISQIHHVTEEEAMDNWLGNVLRIFFASITFKVDYLYHQINRSELPHSSIRVNLPIWGRCSQLIVACGAVSFHPYTSGSVFCDGCWLDTKSTKILKPVEKSFLLEVGMMDELHFRAEMWTLEMLCKVITHILHVEGPKRGLTLKAVTMRVRGSLTAEKWQHFLLLSSSSSTLNISKPTFLYSLCHFL